MLSQDGKQVLQFDAISKEWTHRCRINTGKFVSRLISPKKAEQGLGKVYEVTLQKEMTGKEKELFEGGEMLLRCVTRC